jgi:hypothetical protein
MLGCSSRDKFIRLALAIYRQPYLAFSECRPSVAVAERMKITDREMNINCKGALLEVHGRRWLFQQGV